MSAESAFASLATGLLHEPGVEEGKPFRGPALTYERKIFAMLVQERLVVKLPAVAAPSCAGGLSFSRSSQVGVA